MVEQHDAVVVVEEPAGDREADAPGGTGDDGGADGEATSGRPSRRSVVQDDSIDYTDSIAVNRSERWRP